MDTGKRFRVIYNYPYFLKALAVYTPFAYLINDGLIFTDKYVYTDTGYFPGEQKIFYSEIKSFAKIGKFTLEINLDKNFFPRVKKLKTYSTYYFNKIVEESQAFYINSWNISPIITELERHKIKRLKDS